MTIKQISILIGVLIIIGIAVFAIQAGLKNTVPGSYTSTTNPPKGGTAKACTMEAMMCPDGSYVGRVGPNCQFAACPAPSTDISHATTSGTYTTSIGQNAGGAFLNVSPYEVLEDSRCPIDVQCIQQGTVRVRAHVVHNGTTTNEIFVLNIPRVIASSTITFVQVLPAPTSKIKIVPADYKFKFTIVDASY